MTQQPVTGHAAFYPDRILVVTQLKTTPTIGDITYEFRPIRKPDCDRIEIRAIACTDAEHKAVCRFLAKRRAAAATKRTGTAAKAIHRNQDQ